MITTRYNQRILSKVQEWFLEPSDEAIATGKGKTIDAYILILARTVLTFSATIPDCDLVEWSLATSPELHRAIYHTQSALVTARLWAQISLDETNKDLCPIILNALKQEIKAFKMAEIVDDDLPLFLPLFEDAIDYESIASGNVAVIEEWFDRTSAMFCKICPETLALKESLFYLAIAYLSTNKLIQLSRKEAGNLSRIEHLKQVTRNYQH